MKMTKRQIELLRDLGHLLREIREMTDDETRQILDRAESNEDDQPSTHLVPALVTFSASERTQRKNQT
jgi:Sec-independent protein translocase protein TatA